MLEAFYREHRQEGLEIIAVSTDAPEDETKVREFVKPFSFPVTLASAARMEGYGRIWRLPLSFLLDRNGILKKGDWSGEQKIEAASLKEFVLPLLRQR